MLLPVGTADPGETNPAGFRFYLWGLSHPTAINTMTTTTTMAIPSDEQLVLLAQRQPALARLFIKGSWHPDCSDKELRRMGAVVRNALLKQGQLRRR